MRSSLICPMCTVEQYQEGGSLPANRRSAAAADAADVPWGQFASAGRCTRPGCILRSAATRLLWSASGTGPSTSIPAPVEDVFCAAAWLGANAEKYGLRIDQLVPYGFSFGATLGTTLVTEDDPSRFLTECPDSWSDQIGFAGVVGFSGIYDYPKTVEISAGLADYTNDYLGVYPGGWSGDLGTGLPGIKCGWQRAAVLLHPRAE